MQGISDSQKDPFGDSLGYVIKPGIEQAVVRICIDKSYFYEDSRHLRPSQNHQVRSFIDPEIDKTNLFQLVIDIAGESRCFAVTVINQGFYPGILVRIRAGVAVNGNKIVCPGLVPFCSFLIG